MSDPAVSIVTGIFGFIFYIPLVTPSAILYVSPAIVLCGEIFLTIWWIVSLGVTADDFGAVRCSMFFFANSEVGCGAGKALIAFSAVGFVISLVTLGAVLLFSIHPLVSQGQLKKMFQGGAYTSGGIVLVDGFATAAESDLEKGAEEVTAADEAAPVPVDNAINLTQSTESIKDTEYSEVPIEGRAE
ncbi:hypothetical protein METBISCDRAFT_26095 [Metschnikowia bicuspidata]|uniref:MARVEL domain-containing protein n=1 Tax=Metschnikowia bicuspidata TaxID=27322 RepID=A0A4P9ZFW8_9ASCO|nr:hypothetical protein METBISCDRAFT_26095 [Metschnikowia bicuspidata]